ncbi:MAG: thermonuclease family protein [Hyphomicrobiaceae bacterium]
MVDSKLRLCTLRASFRLAVALCVVTMVTIANFAYARQAPDRFGLGHATVVGRARAIDGDTLAVGGVRIRLEGIDAPESQQMCDDADGHPWACGVEASRLLSQLVAGRLVSCEERGLDKYKRVLGVCRVDGRDINAEMVRQGLAWAFVRYSRSYAREEQSARANRIGIWSGAAQPAWDYRAGHWQTAEVSAPKGCPIKGNVGANGRIYHMPWSPWYQRINMTGGKGKRWFCSEDEAIKAGWRPVGHR